MCVWSVLTVDGVAGGAVGQQAVPGRAGARVAAARVAAPLRARALRALRAALVRVCTVHRTHTGNTTSRTRHQIQVQVLSTTSPAQFYLKYKTSRFTCATFSSAASENTRRNIALLLVEPCKRDSAMNAITVPFFFKYSSIYLDCLHVRLLLETSLNFSVQTKIVDCTYILGKL